MIKVRIGLHSVLIPLFIAFVIRLNAACAVSSTEEGQHGQEGSSNKAVYINSRIASWKLAQVHFSPWYGRKIDNNRYTELSMSIHRLILEIVEHMTDIINGKFCDFFIDHVSTTLLIDYLLLNFLVPQ